MAWADEVDARKRGFKHNRTRMNGPRPRPDHVGTPFGSEIKIICMWQIWFHHLATMVTGGSKYGVNSLFITCFSFWSRQNATIGNGIVRRRMFGEMLLTNILRSSEFGIYLNRVIPINNGLTNCRETYWNIYVSTAPFRLSLSQAELMSTHFKNHNKIHNLCKRHVVCGHQIDFVTMAGPRMPT